VVRGDNRPSRHSIGIGAKILGPSPADIREVTVSQDGGEYYYKFIEDDVGYDFMSGMYYWHGDQVPPNGTYTFSVEDKKGRTATASKSFTFNALPIVDTGITPADSAYVNTTTPSFSWSSVGEGYYYRIMIMHWNGTIVYFSSRSTDTAVTVPPGVLLPNTSYKWRIEVHDGPTGGVVNNRSRTNLMGFSTGPDPYTLDMNFGIVWSDNNYYSGPGKLLATQIVGPLPNDVVDLNVSGPAGYNYDFMHTDIIFNRDDGGIYAHSEPGYPPNGRYNFSVEDVYGAIDTDYKDLIFSEIPIADRSTFSPENKAYITTLTPTLSWAAVSGSPRYYGVIIWDWRRRIIFFNDTATTEIYTTVPDGVLELDATYMWRVDVFDDSSGLVADNRSSSGYYCFTIPSSLDTDGDGIADLVDTAPTVPSNDFSDGTTTGSITDRGDQVLFITDQPHPDGVRITASIDGGPKKAKVSACDGAATYKLTAGDQVVVTCGSLETIILNGTVEILFVAADGTPATTSLDEGYSLVFEPITFTFTAPPTNPDVVVVVVDGKEFSIAPGESERRIVDIKPGSYPNSINLNSKGVVPVAVLTAEDLDASNLDPSTVNFAGASAVRWTLEDVDYDGDVDLLFHFNIQELNLNEDSTEATLFGSTYNGEPFEGTDTVKIVP
jgi:hypothetical protein